MIQCDTCKDGEWFHIRCVGLSEDGNVSSIVLQQASFLILASLFSISTCAQSALVTVSRVSHGLTSVTPMQASLSNSLIRSWYSIVRYNSKIYSRRTGRGVRVALQRSRHRRHRPWIFFNHQRAFLLVDLTSAAFSAWYIVHCNIPMGSNGDTLQSSHVIMIIMLSGLRAVRLKVKNFQIASLFEFQRWMLLIFDNCHTYNGPVSRKGLTVSFVYCVFTFYTLSESYHLEMKSIGRHHVSSLSSQLTLYQSGALH